MSTTESIDWPATIRAARAVKQWTQRQLAEAVGTSQANIARIETGIQVPSVDTVERIMAALNGAALPRVLKVGGRNGGPAGREGSGELHELNVAAMLDTTPSKTEWIVEGIAARGYVTMLAGREGSGKSLLTQAIAGGVATGRSVAGMKCQPGRVWLIDAENGPTLIHQRLRIMLGHRDAENAARRLRVFDADGFDFQRDRAALMGQLDAAEHRPDMIVLDSFKSLWNGSEQNPGAVTVALNELRELAQLYDVAVLLIHHTTKGADTYRGSTAIGATVEAVYTFARPRVPRDYEGDVDARWRELVCRKMRLDSEPGVRNVVFNGSKFEEVKLPWES